MSFTALSDAWGADYKKEDCYSKAMGMVNRTRKSNSELFTQVNADRPSIPPHPSLISSTRRAAVDPEDPISRMVTVKRYLDDEYRNTGVEGVLPLLPTDFILDLQNKIQTEPFISTVKNVISTGSKYGKQMLTLDIDDLINYAVVFLILVLCKDGVVALFKRLFG